MANEAKHGPEGVSINNEASAKIYKPLDSRRQEIRLLTLHPSESEDEEIRCTLSHVTLDPSDDSTSPSYEALSYVWGEPDFSEPIVLNEHAFCITPSLRYALSCLRRTEQTRTLWVDALCINQSDIEERAQQVGLMRKIYSNCERDIAWLDPLIGKHLKSREIYSHPSLQTAERHVKSGISLMEKIAQKNPTTLKQLQDGARDGEFDLSSGKQVLFTCVFKNPTLWNRLWVMQELSLAPRLTLMCNGAELSWDVLTTLFKDEPYIDAFHMKVASHLPEYYQSFSEVFVPIKRIEDQRRLLAQTDKQTSRLMDVLVRFREMDSTDPRDKIFGLLGLVTENHGIKVDYTLSVRQLYRQTALSIINLSGNLDILCQNPFERREGPRIFQQAHSQNELPSWAPEFDSEHEDCVAILFAQRDIFNAGIKSCETPCRLVPGEDILILRGTILGTIGPIRRPGSKSNHVAKPRDFMKNYLDEDAIMNSENHLYAPMVGSKKISTGETLMRAFWRTMVRDCTIPPRMRRLRAAEIDRLDTVNQGELQYEHGYHVKSYRLTGNLYSRSAFSYDPGEDVDLEQLDQDVVADSVDWDMMACGWKERVSLAANFMFAVTDNGLFLMARPHVMEGDVVVVLDGGKVPMVLRKIETKDGIEDGEVYRIVGSAYVHGFMDGEAEVGVTEGWLKKRDIMVA
ncbi:hypothetical protein F53441_485 [Fusarium austroafricanum]|uniref:Heterokaryon incompatibility domain-containing protein n=1 Tax=Fusarium austroafricanum TaxID=2364996 RepID=A0A8H4KUP3_9HYPO|nr:hypothetical protein F53441_485 [Fusarium austroafricanum]